MNIVVRAVLDALKAALVALPGLAGVPVHVVQPGNKTAEVFPHVAIISDRRRFKFERHMSEVVAANGAAGTAVEDVGCWLGRVEVRAGHKTDPERNALEQLVEDLFMAGDPPGALTVQTAALAALSGYQAVGTFDVDDGALDDSRATERARFGGLEVLVTVPILVARTGTYDMDELVLQLTADTSPGETPVTETYNVTEDGELA